MPNVCFSDPALAHEFPQDYLERVKKVHSEGGYGSQGYERFVSAHIFLSRPNVGTSSLLPGTSVTGRSKRPRKTSSVRTRQPSARACCTSSHSKWVARAAFNSFHCTIVYNASLSGIKSWYLPLNTVRKERRRTSTNRTMLRRELQWGACRCK